VQVSIKSRSLSAAILVACVAIASAYGWLAVRAYLAARFGAVPQRASVDRAISLEPGNSEYLHSRGAITLYGEQDARAAIPYFQRAIALNPYRSRYWLDLALSWAVLGDTAKQKSAIESAVIAEPTDPTIVWDAANLMMVSDDMGRAMSLFRTYVDIDPGYSFRAYDICWRALHDADAMLAQVVPPTITARLAFLQYLVKKDAMDDAVKAWKSVLDLHQPLDGEQALPFMDALLQKQSPAQASAVWKAVVDGDPRFTPYATPGNLLVNSRFENLLLNRAFDWRVGSNAAVTVAVDASEFHGGGSSLSFSFSGEPVADTGVFQYVAVEPSTSYQFSAYVRTAEIYSAAGPRFLVEDAYNSEKLLATDAMVGSTGWKQVQGKFRTGASTRLVALRVAQARSTHIKGNLWIGDLSLTRE
jgi:tetratricopeptide (TPR) repeat protein